MLTTPAPPLQVGGVVKRIRKRKGIRAGTLHDLRTGWSHAIQVGQFRERYLAAIKKFDDIKRPTASGADPDLSIEDVRVRTPFQVVDKFIGDIVGHLQARSGSDRSKHDHGEPGKLVPQMDELRKRLEPLIVYKSKARRPRPRDESNSLSDAIIQREVELKTKSKQSSPSWREGEIVLSISVFHPEHMHRNQEFLVLGSQPLTELRDAISCATSREPGSELMSSACFFFEGKFFNDMRNSHAIKYSDPIISWVRQDERYTQPGLSHFEAFEMQKTSFDDLSVRLGSHYLFCHQGDCLHTIIVSDLRIAGPDDVRHSAAYPLRIFQVKVSRKKCRVCDLFPATLVTYGDRLAPENPFFWCSKCYRMYHYNEQGKIYYDDFQVFPYGYD